MMRWAVIVCLIAGAGALARQVKESAADVRAAPEAKAAFDRGRTTHNAGKTDEAVSFFERAVALESTSSLYHMWLGHVSGQHPPRGEAALRRLLTLTPADPVRQSNTHYRLGMIKEKTGDARAAATEYQAAVDLYPRHEPESRVVLSVESARAVI